MHQKVLRSHSRDHHSSWF